MKNKGKRKKLIAIFLVILVTIIVSTIIYTNLTSAVSTSEDNLWRAVTFKENLLLPLWTGRIFYFGEEAVGRIRIESIIDGETYCIDASPLSERPSLYEKILAGNSVTDYYYFCDLHYDSPEIEEIKISWTDVRGSQHDCLLSFK